MSFITRTSASQKALILLWVLALATLAWWVGSTPEAVLRDELRHLQFWALEAQFALLLFTTIVGTHALVSSLKVPRSAWLAPLALSLGVLAFIVTVVPRTNRIFYDEQIYQSIGQSFADLRLAQMCNEGSVQSGHLECQRGEYNKQPYGYSYLLSIGYRLFGVSESLAHAVNAIVAAALVWAVFLLTLALFADVRGATFAALVTTLLPEHLLWSHTAAAEPSAVLASVVALLAIASFVRLRTDATLLWATTATAFSLQFRPESVLVLACVALALVLWAREEWRKPRLWWAALLGLGLCAVPVAHLVAVRNEGWGTTGQRLSLDYVWMNLLVNGRFYLWDERFPAFVALLALAAVVTVRTKATLLMAAWFLTFWSVFLFFYAGSYDYGADVRYSLITYPPLSILAGIGASQLCAWVPRRSTASLATAAIVLAFGVQFLWSLPRVRSVGEEAWAARADVAFAQRIARTLPNDAIVLTHNPNMFLVWGINAAQLSLATSEPDYVRDALPKRYPGGVYVHWSFWCNVTDPVQTAFCKTAVSEYGTDKVADETVRDYRFAFYKIRSQRSVL